MQRIPCAHLVACAAAIIGLLLPGAASAKSHLWRFTEFFSDSSGQIQFIEMVEIEGSSVETQFSGRPLTSNANTYLFPNDLVGDTANRWVLIATQGFADLSGAPTPDFIIPDGFFDPAGDEIRYRSTIDLVTIPSGAMLTDGVHSVDRDMQQQVNDPTNFAGVTGSVVVQIPALGAIWLATLTLALLLFARRPLWNRTR